MELTLKIVVPCHCTLALEHLDLDFLNHGRLVLHRNRHVDNPVHGLYDWNVHHFTDGLGLRIVDGFLFNLNCSKLSSVRHKKNMSLNLWNWRVHSLLHGASLQPVLWDELHNFVFLPGAVLHRFLWDAFSRL